MSTHALSSPSAPQHLRLDPRDLLRRAYATNAPLTLAGLAMVAALLISVAGLVADRQIITGAPAWLKPFKFALSFGVYSFTLVYLLSFVRRHRRLVTLCSVLIAVGIVIEMFLIALQVARGTTSHFNFTTPFNAAVFDAMGGFVVIVWLMSLVIAVLLLRQPLPDAAWAWTLRLGLLVSLVGMAMALPMLRATPLQIAAAHGGALRNVGAHTVGAPDGGPGLPFLSWSTVAGDLRIPHFIGIHGLQILLLVGWLLTLAPAWLDGRHRLALVWIAGLGYLALILLLEWQALRGQSIVRPDAATLGAFAALAAAGAVSAGLVVFDARRRSIVPLEVAGKPQ